MTNITHARQALVTRILEGDGKAQHVQRRSAFDNAVLIEPLKTLIDKVAHHAYRVTGADIVCAAVGEASRQYDKALAALAAATEERRDAS
jgi:hypothetical protein